MGKVLVILALLVVLAGAVFTFAAMSPAGDATKWQARVAGVFGGLVADDLTPDDLDIRRGGCSINGAVMTIPSGAQCTLNIQRSDTRLRRGTLQISRGSVRIQALKSDYGGPAKTIDVGDSYELNVERSGETVSLSCRNSESCQLALRVSS